MHVQRIADADRYSPKGHPGVGPVYLQGGVEYDGVISVVLSHYLPGAHAELAMLAVETIYVVLTGELYVESGSDTATLHSYDSVSLVAGEHRYIENRTNLPTTILVIRPNPGGWRFVGEGDDMSDALDCRLVGGLSTNGPSAVTRAAPRASGPPGR